MMEKCSESSMKLRKMPLRLYMCIVTGGMPCRSQSGCSRNISSFSSFGSLPSILFSSRVFSRIPSPEHWNLESGGGGS